MPKVVDHDERRQAFAAATARTIGTYGIESVTMTRVAKAAGVTTGSLTHYFKDKDEIILAALEWANGAMHRRAEEAIQRGDDAITVLMSVLPTDRARLAEWRTWIVFGDRATRSSRLMKAKRATYRAWSDLLARGFREQQDRGELSSDLDLELEAESMVVLVAGLGDLAAGDPKSWPASRQRAVLERYVERLSG